MRGRMRTVGSGIREVNGRASEGERELLEELQERSIVRELIENRVLWRDAHVG